MEGLILIVGILGGWIGAYLFFKRTPIGTLRIDNSDPESSPYLFLEIDYDKAYLLDRSKEITVRVDCSQN